MLTFLRWAGERDFRRPEQVDKATIEAYRGWLFHYRKADGSPLCVTTQRGRLGAVQVFFAWLCREHRISADPAATLDGEVVAGGGEKRRKPVEAQRRAESRRCRRLPRPTQTGCV